MLLRKREFEILQLLLSNPKKIFSKINIFETLWKDEYFNDDNTVNVHISRLRSKLEEANSKEDYIETIWGIGYRLKS